MSLRQLPAVHVLVAAIAQHLPDVPPHIITTTARQTLIEQRQQIKAGQPALDRNELIQLCVDTIKQQLRPSLRPVINASGVIIQTNLGRAPLSAAAREAMNAIGMGYSNLEYDLAHGERGSRNVHLEAQLCRLTGAEAALVVNNAAAAMYFVLSCFASGREVLVSRGQAVEIGGGFRIPDILRQSGCHLGDVGTTNRTYIHDYASAITPNTAAILRVHSSNFQLIGFTHEPTLSALADLAHAHNVMLIDDLGSGALLDTAQFGLAHEPMVQESVPFADLTIFSGDKLLGGLQAGIIVGRRSVIKLLASHPLMRALRVDKITIAGLHATLNAYERQTALSEIPIWRMISMTVDELHARAVTIQAYFGDEVQIVPSMAAVGGGSLPGATMPSVALQLKSDQPNELAKRLRMGEPAVVARIENDHVLLDLRSVLPEQDELLVEAIKLVR